MDILNALAAHVIQNNLAERASGLPELGLDEAPSNPTRNNINPRASIPNPKDLRTVAPDINPQKIFINPESIGQKH